MTTSLPEPALVFLVGASGSGKSSWAAGRFLPEEIVSSDALRAIVGSGESDMDASADAFELLDTIVERRLGRRLTTIVDTTGLDADLRGRCLDLAHSNGLPAVAVVFDTPLRVCRLRNVGRSKAVPARVVEGQHRRVRELDLSGEPWDRVETVVSTVSTPADPPVAASERTVESTNQSPTGIDFVLHVSRFDWDRPLEDALTAIATAAESAGFAGLSVMDHFVQIPQVGRPWEDIPECIATLSFLAGVTERIELGPLVVNARLRNPGLLAKSMASLDVLSGGRMFCGIGAGWFAAEERAYGYEEVSVRQRLDTLEDAARLLPAMWSKGATTLSGHTVEVEGATAYPRPRHRIPLLIGGAGERRTLRIAAEHADAVNIVGADVETIRRKRRVLDEHCAVVGRDPAEVAMTILDVALLGEDRRHVADLVETHRGRSSVSSFRERVGAGTVDQLIDRYMTLTEEGISRAFVTMPHLSGPEQVRAFAAVATAFR